MGKRLIIVGANFSAISINYSVTNTLANCTSNNSATSVSQGASYSATLTADSGYTLTGATASVTMGGVDITSTAYSAGVITISSVTGAIAITVSAIQSVSGFNLYTSNVSIPHNNYAYFEITFGDGTTTSAQLGDTKTIGSQTSNNYPKVSNPIPNVTKIRLYTYKDYPSVPYIKMTTSGTVLNQRQLGGSIELTLTADTTVITLDGNA